MNFDLDAHHRQRLLDALAPIRSRAEAALALFDEGATLPFIARYRKEQTGGLNETQLKEIQDKRNVFAKLSARKATILKSIGEQEKLTPELTQQVIDCMDKQRLEDLYLPYKPKRRTRAQAAREKGCEPLAELLWAHRPATGNREEIAGACDILAERISEHTPPGNGSGNIPSAMEPSDRKRNGVPRGISPGSKCTSTFGNRSPASPATGSSP